MSLKTVNILFAGDSGDGMQVTGQQFGNTAAILGNDVHTLPDFPAEIRAPAGTMPGVSGFQISFSERIIHTPGDKLDVLVAFNPPALQANLKLLKPKGILILNEEAFTEKAFKKAGLTADPREDELLKGCQRFDLPLTSLTVNAVSEFNLTHSQANRSKNMFALGVLYWLFDKKVEATNDWIAKKYEKDATLVASNQAVLKAGYNYALTAELFAEQYPVGKAALPAGQYRQITGNEAFGLALATAAHLSKRQVLLSGYPITPSSTVLHEAVKYNEHNVGVFQAEDEIAAMSATVGAAYGGSLAATVTSGPGFDLKAEALGLAVMTELPLVLINVQRAGPSTGMPTKPQQADLLQACFGRHGECPVPVLAAQSASDCFTILLEAFELAIRFMTPVIVLSDAYLASGSEPWLLPDINTLPDLTPDFAKPQENFQPYARNDDLSRPWAIPGTLDLMHRIGGLEKAENTGAVSYDPDNHETMVKLREAKIQTLAEAYPVPEMLGNPSGDTLVIAWGSTHGAVLTAIERLHEQGVDISYVHLRHVYPLAPAFGDIVKNFKRVLVPELNRGQLTQLLRTAFNVDAVCHSKVSGKPFYVDELMEAFQA